MAACPTQISEGCPPNANCSSSVCGPTASCPAWQNQTTTNCCSYLCGSGTTAPARCFAKWFDNIGNALNCDPCAGALCQNRTQIEADCARQYGANGYDLVQPDSNARRCCLTCKAKPFSCPTVIAEKCSPATNCTNAVCGNSTSCPAWDGQRETHCCPYQCQTGCFGKWFDNVGNALNCDPCAGAACQNRTQIEADCARQFGANGYDLIQPDSSKRRCCLTCQAKAPAPFSCPTVIAENCPPASNCTSKVCTNTTCPAWDGQRATNCCAYSCNGQCYSKWFDNASNALNCDVCAGAQCQNRTQIEAQCTAQYGAGLYELIQPDSSKRRCCLTCQAKPFTCPTVISENCPPSSNCTTAACPTGASCPAWDGQRATNCCSYSCNGKCFGKWFDNVGNALNCDVCAGAQCQNRTQIEAGCAAQYGQNGYDLIQPDASKNRCCVTCQAKVFSCPTLIAEGCPPSSNCSTAVCGPTSSCPAWDGQRATNCCAYACNGQCLGKWFDNSSNVLNCDVCAGAACQNRTQIEAGCITQFGAGKYQLLQPDSSKRRCCFTCVALNVDITSSSGVDSTSSEVVGSTSSNQEATSSNQDSVSSGDSTSIGNSDSDSGTIIEKTGVDVTTDAASADTVNFAVVREASLALIAVAIAMANL